VGLVLRVSLVIGVMIAGLWYRRWSRYCYDRARACEWNGQLCRLMEQDQKDPRTPRANEHNVAMNRKYRMAAAFPWMSVEPDRPEAR
jgi:hypothetical protein